MTVQRGETWGRPYDHDRPPAAASDDAELASMAYDRQADDIPPVMSVASGDLLAGLGHSAGSVTTPAVAYPMDLGVVEFGSSRGVVELTVPFVAHVLGFRSRLMLPDSLRWPELIVMNSPLLGDRRLGPKAHPNDGLLDITSGSIPPAQRREAIRRARSGSHVPHPNLTTRRAATHEVQWGRGLRCRVDGVDRGRWRWIRLSVIPDAYVLVVGETSGPAGS